MDDHGRFHLSFRGAAFVSEKRNIPSLLEHPIVLLRQVWRNHGRDSYSGSPGSYYFPVSFENDAENCLCGAKGNGGLCCVISLIHNGKEPIR
ncbi:hypothetical protein HNY73_016142 [Argiope bruennichi]|uniref:Uncharacterized protein n=1 Tax=Argiope bruennichi TaxID=94029 RepID=A0A8T0EHJ2_ARGBR|nr:hypothetical protein HNY73_016142 [Argiope bruennichi]